MRGGRIVYPRARRRGRAPARAATPGSIELAGRAVTPGLIDAHSHLAGLGARPGAGRPARRRHLRGGRRAGCARRPGRLPAGTWVHGRGWDQNRWPGQAVPHPRGALGGGPRPSRLADPRRRPRRPGQRPGDGDPGDRRAPSRTPPAAASCATPQGDPRACWSTTPWDGPKRGCPRPPPRTAGATSAAPRRHCLELGLTTVTDMGVGQADVEAY